MDSDSPPMLSGRGGRGGIVGGPEIGCCHDFIRSWLVARLKLGDIPRHGSYLTYTKQWSAGVSELVFF